MNIKYKISMIFSVALLLSVGAYFVISNIFKNMERQLLDKCRIEAYIGAESIAKMMELMIIGNIIPEQDLFDTNYIEIPGSNPKRYRTKYDALLDTHIQKFQDNFLIHDPDVVYSVIVDRNGYAPTHNSTYSQPPTNDTAFNLKFSRSKRKFDDPVGLKAARHEGPTTIEQLYPRDTGEYIWDIAAPIKVNNKHWGAFRIGVSLQRIEEIKNNMLLIIVMTIFIIVSITLLTLLMILPRKLFESDLITKNY
ncbi:MAG: HAMP domain-containing protein [Spirochaetes bacterium]|nr:HAMP domain-containing protein [Spirochaetota bacterium]